MFMGQKSTGYDCHLFEMSDTRINGTDPVPPYPLAIHSNSKQLKRKVAAQSPDNVNFTL